MCVRVCVCARLLYNVYSVLTSSQSSSLRLRSNVNRDSQRARNKYDLIFGLTIYFVPLFFY